MNSEDEIKEIDLTKKQAYHITLVKVKLTIPNISLINISPRFN